MKKITLILTLVFLTTMLQAQLFIGTQLGFNSTTETLKPNVGNEQKERSTTLTIGAMAGYQLNDKFAVGARLNYMFQNETIFKYFGMDDDFVTKSTVFAAEAFCQYTFARFGKFSVFADVGIGFGTGNAKMSFGSSSEDLRKMNVFAIGIRPVLAYDLSEKITLLANLNFLGFGFTSTTKEEFYPNKNKTTENEFDFNLNSDNIATVSALTIGFIYRF